jgi:hypothetical protein
MITDRMRVDVTEIEFVEIGEEGVRITFKSGDRKFVGGDEGLKLHQRWKENGGRDAD